MILYALLYLSYILTLVLGFYLGILKQSPQEQDKQQPMKRISNTTSDVGIIKRPDVTELNKRNEPAIIKAEKDEMKKTLDSIPELQEIKRLAEQYKKKHRM